jgi:hypothetical protein
LYIAETTQKIRTFWVAVPAAKGGGGDEGIRTLETLPGLLP